MKKAIFGIFTLLLAGVGFTASAQTSSLSEKTSKQVCSKKSTCCKESKSCADKQCNSKDIEKKKCVRDPFAELNLTAEQQKKIDAINEQYRPKRGGNLDKNAKADENGQNYDRGAKRKEAKEKRDEYLGKIKEVLTPEQYTKFLDSLPKDGHHHMKHGPREGKGIKGMRK